MIPSIGTDQRVGVAVALQTAFTAGKAVSTIPAAVTEYPVDSTYSRLMVDLTGREFVRMAGWCTTGGANSGKTLIRYTIVATDQSVPVTLIDQSVALTHVTTSSTVVQVTSPWYSIPAAARCPVVTSVWTIGGDGIAGATTKGIVLVYK